jgi:hypothetical protein
MDFFVGPEMAVRQRWDGLFPLNIREAQWKAPAGAEILLKKSQQLCYDWTVKSISTGDGARLIKAVTDVSML